MREVAGAVVVLAASILIAAGVLAEAVTRGIGGYGTLAYVLGSVVGVAVVVLLLGGALRRWWDDIPTDDRGSQSPRPDNPAERDRA
jgi:hypothetical protein